MKRRFWGRAAVNMMVWAWCVLFLWGCGYSGEEKQRMEEIARQGEDGQELNRFELLERDGVIFVCVDKRDGDDLEIGMGEKAWLELGETKGEPVSQVYSVNRDDVGEVTVFFPVERDGGKGSVWIQHKIEGDGWRQYEAGREMTRDGKYVFVTYHGIPDSQFEVGVFEGL